MEIDYLCEFSVIAGLGSFSLAAEELCISQSSLSKHIIALEKELDVKLFNRTTRNITLSEAGKQILPYAVQALEIKKRILGAAAEQSKRNKKAVPIASIPVMAQYEITGAITEFQKKHPEIDLLISECEYNEISRLLESEKYELAFTRIGREESPDLEYAGFRKDYLVAVLPNSHPLSSEKALSLKQLQNEGFLFLDKETSLYKLCFDLCREAGFTPNVKYTGHRPENIIDLVSQGMGIALLMKRHTDYFNNLGVTCIDVTPTVESSICLARLKAHPLSKSARVFWDYINGLYHH